MIIKQDPRDIIIQVLTIIGYEDNKDTYADEFIQNCEKQALLDLLQALPQEQQEVFKQQIAKVTDQEQQKTIIHEYIKPEQYQQILQKASQIAFVGLLKDLIPTLSQPEATQLQTYLKSIVSQ